MTGGWYNSFKERIIDEPLTRERLARLVLMESRLTPRGAVYAPLLTLPLRGGSGNEPV